MPFVRRSARVGASRRAAAWALAAVAPALPLAACAQVVGTLGVASVNRYRGVGTDDRGPVLRASVMADSPFAATSGAYVGLAGLWRTRDAGLASVDALAGWSGRFNALAAFDGLAPGWGWDAGVHRTHYGESSRYDFSEAMVGLLAPGWSARAWWAPHYFGGSTPTVYGELNASKDLDEHWQAFAHVGAIRYGHAAYGQPRIAGRTDTLVGIGYSRDAWDLRVSRDGLLSGNAHADFEQRRRRAAWVLGASVAF